MVDNVATLRSTYAAFARGDVPALLSVMAPNVRWTVADGFPYGGTFVGPIAVLEGVFVKLRAEWEGLAVVPQEFIAQGDSVVALGQHSGTYKSTGKSFSAPFAHVWTLENGRVVRYRQYTDTALVQAALT